MADKHSDRVSRMREIRSRKPDAPFDRILKECEPDSRATIVELACIDLIDRIRSGASVGVEDYLSQVPELLADSDDLLDLIDAEICTRRELGLTPDFDDYVRRFPDLSTQVERLFVLDDIETKLESDAIPVRDKLPEIEGFRLTRRMFLDSSSATYRAQDSNRRPCLLRLFEEGSRDNRRLNAALKSARDVRHPAVLLIQRLGAIDDRLYFTTDLVDGLPLSTLIVDGQSARKVASWLNPVILAAAFARGEGQCLGRIGIEHILIDHKDQPRVVGFGSWSNDEFNFDDVQSVIENFGGMMFHMMTGKVFERRTAAADGPVIDSMTLDSDPARPIDSVLEQICLRCLGLISPCYTDLTTISDELNLYLSGRAKPIPDESAGFLRRLLRRT